MVFGSIAPQTPDLRKHYANILQLIIWLSPVAADWCRAYCRFESIYPVEGVVLET